MRENKCIHSKATKFHSSTRKCNNCNWHIFHIFQVCVKHCITSIICIWISLQKSSLTLQQNTLNLQCITLQQKVKYNAIFANI